MILKSRYKEKEMTQEGNYFSVITMTIVYNNNKVNDLFISIQARKKSENENKKNNIASMFISFTKKLFSISRFAQR